MTAMTGEEVAQGTGEGPLSVEGTWEGFLVVEASVLRDGSMEGLERRQMLDGTMALCTEADSSTRAARSILRV
jgi:hypothetical protein